MKKMLMIAACLVAACTLSACAVSTEDCETAKRGVGWAEAVFHSVCTGQASKACDAAGLALKIANTSAAALCPAGELR